MTTKPNPDQDADHAEERGYTTQPPRQYLPGLFDWMIVTPPLLGGGVLLLRRLLVSDPVGARAGMLPSLDGLVPFMLFFGFLGLTFMAGVTFKFLELTLGRLAPQQARS
jgi:hypothetical protein